MKEGWAKHELEVLTKEFTDGDWIESKDQAESGIRLVQTGNVGVGEFKDRRDKARWISEETFARLKCFEVFPGDCLISRLPDPVGRACIIPEVHDRMITAVDCAVVRADPAKMDPMYFVYYSQSQQYIRSVDDKCTGTTRRRISRKNLGKIEVPIPPLDEQKRIVSILDQAFEGLDRARVNAEANLESASELNESIKTSVLARNSIDGKRVKLSEVSDITSSLVDPKQMEYRHLPHIGAGNMVTLSDDLIEVKTAAEENLISQKYLYDDTMVLYSKIRPYLRKAARPSFGGLCSADVYPLKPAVGVLDRDFLFHILLSDDFTKYAEAGSARAGMPKVNRKHLFNYEFSLPSISDQKDMVAAIDRTKGHIALLVNKGQRKLSKVEDLRQSLLQKAFSGELT